MAAPPPQNDDSKPEVITFGIAAVDAALEETEITFPTDRETLVAALGEEEIPYDTRGRSVAFEAALAEVDQDEFESRRELMNALHPVFEARRGSGGIGGWLRAIFPF